MPTTQQLQDKLIKKLKELFQLNQPDLDFGFYRIMHAKSEQITQFIENDLPKLIREAFKPLTDAQLCALKQDYEDELAKAVKYNAPKPEEVEDVKEAKAKYDASLDTSTIQGDIYDHLYRFFERYYDDGDFISRRYYTRETASKAAPFAIPYNGEEVKLHWANADQYYIKSTEYFTNYTINLSQALQDLIKKPKNEQDDFYEETIPENLKVTFRIIDATEGDHGNIKASDATKRFFIIHQEKPIEIGENGELLINFEYRPDAQKAKQEKRNEESVAVIINALQELPSAENYKRLITILAPTEKDKNRPLLTKYINQYTSKNTMDYFIHKDLGRFLKRELDFYIKNEVMHLDDIENADVPSVESYLSKIKVMRRIAGKLIEFLAQLEDFQKKLWLKKKFVVETNYCITLDRVPKELYPEIAKNARQVEEWVKLFAIDEILDDKSISIEFLKSNSNLLIDTAFYSVDFKYRLLSSIGDLDDKSDGLLIHSENVQALNLLQERYREQIKCVYIDPPYNTGDDGFVYKDSYQGSSWLSMFADRLKLSYSFLNAEGLLSCHMDEHEHLSLEWLIKQCFGDNGDLGKLIWDKRNPKGDAKGIAAQHEYVHFATNNPSHLKDVENAFARNKENADAILIKAKQLINKDGGVTQAVKKQFKSWINKHEFSGGEKAYSLIDYNGDVYQSVSMAWPNKKKAPDEYFIPLIHPITHKVCPLPSRGWRNPPKTMLNLKEKGFILFGEDENTIPRRKYFLTENLTENVSSLYYMGSSDDALFEDMSFVFDNPKPIKAAKYFLSIIARTYNSIVFDYFAGSGTTGHAVINLNREDDGKRKYILVEMGDYFDTVLKPRIMKVAYSKDWKNGKPTARDTGISHCFKYIRLESYEDTLNNLVFNENNTRDEVLENNPALKEDYLLHYMLDVETKESQSLLNIDSFVNPYDYKLKVKKPGSDEYSEVNVDLLETFNYLIGLRVDHISRPAWFKADFKREPDPDLPSDQNTKLILKGDIKQDSQGKWLIQKIEGRIPRNPYSPNDGLEDKVLIIWRNLTGNLEEDNLVLDTWFQKNKISTLDWEFDTIFVNGSNNLPNLKKEEETWKVKLTEEEFFKQMWSTEGI